MVAECAAYDEAVDAAFAYLEANDPAREGKVGALQIVRIAGDERKPVWEYTHERSQATKRDLVGHWGFDVTKPWGRAAR